MQVGIVVSNPEDWTAKSLFAAFQARGAKAEFLNFSELELLIDGKLSMKSHGVDLAQLDVIVVRDLGRRAAHDVALRFEVLNSLQEMGVCIINPPEAIARAANKFATSVALRRLEVPTPKTTITTDIEMALHALRNYKKAVSKPLFGYKGRDISLIEDGDEEKLCRIMEKYGLVYLQEFIDIPRPRDIRAFVIGSRTVATIYRVAPDGAWISNLAMGGKAEPCPMTEELVGMAVSANKAVGTIYSGVDLLETRNGLKVIEVNGTPSGMGIYQALGIDVTRMIADIVFEL